MVSIFPRDSLIHDHQLNKSMEGDSTSIDGNFNSNAAHINIADSVIMGDITQQTIIQNSPEDLAKAMALVLEKLGFVGNSQQ